jgi:hypothetical protein
MSQDLNVLLITGQGVCCLVDVREQGLACPVGRAQLSVHGEVTTGHLFDALDFGSRDGSSEGLAACKIDMVGFLAARILIAT